VGVVESAAPTVTLPRPHCHQARPDAAVKQHRTLVCPIAAIRELCRATDVLLDGDGRSRYLVVPQRPAGQLSPRIPLMTR
jgi:hypothetical protein